MTVNLPAVACAAVLALPLSAAVQARPHGPEAGQLQAPRAAADDIVEDPGKYAGRLVSVDASVEDVYSPRWFSIDEDRLWTSGRDLLVLNPNPAARVDDGDDVTVTGEVRLFTRMSIERELDDLDWDIEPDLIVAFTNRPVVVARSIRTDDGAELVHDNGREPQSLHPAIGRVPAGHPASASLPPPTIVPADDLDDDLDDYVGRTVQVQAEVDERHSLTVFTLDDDVVVVAPNIRRAVDKDARLTIVGVVTRLDGGEIELRVPGYRLDLLPEARDDFDDRPIIVASSILTESGEELIGR